MNLVIQSLYCTSFENKRSKTSKHLWSTVWGISSLSSGHQTIATCHMYWFYYSILFTNVHCTCQTHEKVIVFSIYTSRYTCNWNTAKVEVKHQSINQSVCLLTCSFYEWLFHTNFLATTILLKYCWMWH